MDVRRGNDWIDVVIEDFSSPAIVERLQEPDGREPAIDDWRAMVDCVLIDPAWDGHVFNVVLSDAPARRTDLVSGRYRFPAPPCETQVAVKIIDMLGEEVVVTARV